MNISRTRDVGRRARIAALTLLTVSMAIPAVETLSSSSVSAAPPPATLVAYDSVGPGPLAAVRSVGFEANSASEFGDLVQLAVGPRALTSVSTVLGSYGCEIGSGTSCITTPGKTFDHSLTMTLYNVTDVGGVPAAGTPIASITKTVAVPYRPTYSPQCAVATPPVAGGYLSAVDNTCHTNIAVPVQFDFPSNPILPTRVIWGVSFRTTHYGRADQGGPIGSAPCASNCGYDSLNVGVSQTAAPFAGTDPDPDGVFWNTSYAPFYCDGGAAGVGTFRLDTGPPTPCWTGDRPMAALTTKALAYTATTTKVDRLSLGAGTWNVWQETSPEMVIPSTFVNGPATPPLGDGSLQLSVSGPTQGTSVRTPAYANTKLADIQTLSYSVYSATSAIPNLSFDVNFAGEGGYSGRLVYEPINSGLTPAPNTWNTFNTLNGRWWASKQSASGNQCANIAGPGGWCTWAEILQKWPNAKISGNLVSQLGSGIPAATVNVDNVSIGTLQSSGNIVETTFDFENKCTTTCFVSTTGNDSNTGTSAAQPLLTIQKAVDSLTAGGTINVADGTYNGAVVINKALTLDGASTTGTIVTNPGGNGITLVAPPAPAPSVLSNVTVKDLTITGSVEGVASQAVDLVGTTFTDVSSSNNTGYGFRFQNFVVTDFTATRVRASNNGSGDTAGRGLIIQNGPKTNIVIVDGVFNDNRLTGIDINDGTVNGLTITGNQASRNGDEGIGVVGSIGPNATLVSNNTIADNGRYGIEVKNSTGNSGATSGPGSLVVSNNTITLGAAHVAPASSGTPPNDHRDYAGISVTRRGPIAPQPGQPSGAAVIQNTVTGFRQLAFPADGDGFGIVVEGADNVVTGNTVSANDVGIQIQSNNANQNKTGFTTFDRGDGGTASALINRNAITANIDAALRNVDAPLTNATCNYFGSATGPAAGSVDGSFTTTPFLQSPDLTASCPATVPGAPTNVVATAGNGSATVTFAAPASNGGSPITGYTAAPTSGPGTCVVTNLTASCTGLINGSPITITVSAINAVGTGPGTASNTITPTGAPGAPTNVVATAGNASATVTFTAPASNGGSPITSYTAAPTSGPGTCVVTGLTASCTGLTNGSPITITVRALNAVGTGPGAVSNTITPTAPATAPGAPTNVIATAGDASANVTFVAPASNGGSPVTSYTVVPNGGPGTCVVSGLTASCTGLTNGTPYTFAVRAVNAVGASAATNSNQVTPVAVVVGPPLVPSQVLDFNPAGPRRVFDTRPGESLDALRQVTKQKIGNAVTLSVQMTNLVGLVPADGVGAVSLNVTATNAANDGFITVYPCGTQEFVSSVNFTPGKNVANAVIAPVSADGKVCFFSSQPVDLIADVNGWFATGKAFVAAGPKRVFDTRQGQSPDAVVAVPKTKLAAGQQLTVKMTGLGGLTPATGVDTVSLNVTVANPEGAGYITVYDCGTREEVSSVNYALGQTVANAVLAPLSDNGTVCFYTQQTTDIVVDINGYLIDPSGFTGVSSKRVLDTRPASSPNAFVNVPKTKIGGNIVLEVQLTGLPGAVPADGVSAVSLNVTAVDPALDGYITVFPCGSLPDSSNVNYNTGQTVANAVITPVSATGKVCFYSQNLTDLVVDVNGWFSNVPS